MGNEKSIHSLLVPLGLESGGTWLSPRSSSIAYQMTLKQTVSLKELHQDIFHPGFAHGLDFVDQPYGFLLDLEKACQVHGGRHHNYISWGLVDGGF